MIKGCKIKGSRKIANWELLFALCYSTKTGRLRKREE